MKEPLLPRKPTESPPSTSSASPSLMASSPSPPTLPPSRNTMEPTPSSATSPLSTPSRNRVEPSALPQTSTTSTQAHSENNNSPTIESDNNPPRNNTDSENNNPQTNESDNNPPTNNTTDRTDTGNNTATIFNGPVDIAYFIVATITTIGYGDIVPQCAKGKLCTALLALIGLQLYSALVTCLQDWAMAAGLRRLTSLGTVNGNWLHTLFHKSMQSMIIKVILALAVLFVCVFVGAMLVKHIENQSWGDSFYLSLITATTIGYGDNSFKTKTGRIVAIFWLCITTSTYSRALSYLTFYSWRTSP